MSLRIIQVGVGGVGENWLPIITGKPEIEPVAFVDTNEQALTEAAERYSINPAFCYTDLDKALEEVEADALLCATPPSSHRDIALSAFCTGLHVLMENPLADSMTHAREIVQAAERCGAKLMVSQNFRFQRWARTLREIVESEQLGDLESVTVRYAMFPDLPQDFRATEPYPLILHMSIHHLDLLRYVIGLDPEVVTAKSWNPSGSNFENDVACEVLFDFENGIDVVYDGNWVAREAETDWNGDWRIEFSEGVALYQDEMVSIAEGPGGREKEVVLVDMPAESQEYALLEFADAIQTDIEPETSGNDNMMSLSMVFASIESIESGKPVKISELLMGCADTG